MEPNNEPTVEQTTDILVMILQLNPVRNRLRVSSPATSGDIHNLMKIGCELMFSGNAETIAAWQQRCRAQLVEISQLEALK